MKSVFTLWHIHEVEGEEDEDRFIGVFSSREEAENIMESFKTKPGFKEAPDGFIIDEYQLGKTHWESGFILDDINNDSL